MGEAFLIVAAESDPAGMHHIGGTPLGGSSLLLRLLRALDGGTGLVRNVERARFFFLR